MRLIYFDNIQLQFLPLKVFARDSLISFADNDDYWCNKVNWCFFKKNLLNTLYNQ
jgi:hypothetical protein